MVANISYNPQATTVTAGLFNIESVGLVQGTAYPDPAIRFKLAAGLLSQSETLPIWGGVGIYTDVPGVTGAPAAALGPIVGRATAIANLVAFSVFDQAYGMINTPQSPVQLAGSGQQVMYYRLGSGARIAVPASPALVSLQGGLTTQEVSWDFIGQQLIPYQAAYNSASVASATYTSSTGVLAVTFASAPAGSSPTVGATFSISGMTTSAGNASLVNGDFALVSSGSSGEVLNFNIGSGLGTITINSSTGTLAAGGGTLPCQVLDIQSSNCQVVEYNPSTGFATWNFDGACAVILI